MQVPEPNGDQIAERPDCDLNGSQLPIGEQNKPFWTPLGLHGNLGRLQVAIRSPKNLVLALAFTSEIDCGKTRKPNKYLYKENNETMNEKIIARHYSQLSSFRYCPSQQVAYCNRNNFYLLFLWLAIALKRCTDLHNHNLS